LKKVPANNLSQSFQIEFEIVWKESPIESVAVDRVFSYLAEKNQEDKPEKEQETEGGRVVSLSECLQLSQEPE
jgi:predicted metal-dependent peptidase